MRIFVDEREEFEGKTLYAAIVDMLKSDGFAGATVLMGLEGFGPKGILHSSRAVEHMDHLPILIEVIDDEEKVASVIPRLKEMIPEGLITLERLDYMRLSAPKHD
ncbi:MAG: DUF190 domain-containing protein [bacterium]|nr:DUF190 domain-containing protein [bacterium]